MPQVWPPGHQAPVAEGWSSAPIPCASRVGGRAPREGRRQSWLQSGWGPFQHIQIPSWGKKAPRSAEARHPSREKRDPRGVQ